MSNEWSNVYWLKSQVLKVKWRNDSRIIYFVVYYNYAYICYRLSKVKKSFNYADHDTDKEFNFPVLLQQIQYIN